MPQLYVVLCGGEMETQGERNTQIVISIIAIIQNLLCSSTMLNTLHTSFCSIPSKSLMVFSLFYGRGGLNLRMLRCGQAHPTWSTELGWALTPRHQSVRCQRTQKSNCPVTSKEERDLLGGL